ncbi:Uncharacterised protein [Mycobacterium tuberculosis]|nr:Uncharacterised protein [Mycobacterium tuberculosis]
MYVFFFLKIMRKIQTVPILLYTFMTGKMFLIAKSLSLDIHGRLSQLSNEIRISVA